MNFLSETVLWITSSEFVDSKGNISRGQGESEINVSEELITNNSWVVMGGNKIENNYSIRKVTDTRYQYSSQNPDLGIQKGFFDINRNYIFSKFRIEGTSLNGYEVIERKYDICYANGALYDGNELINTWTAEMRKQ